MEMRQLSLEFTGGIIVWAVVTKAALAAWLLLSGRNNVRSLILSSSRFIYKYQQVHTRRAGAALKTTVSTFITVSTGGQ